MDNPISLFVSLVMVAGGIIGGFIEDLSSALTNQSMRGAYE